MEEAERRSSRGTSIWLRYAVMAAILLLSANGAYAAYRRLLAPRIDRALPSEHPRDTPVRPPSPSSEEPPSSADAPPAVPEPSESTAEANPPRTAKPKAARHGSSLAHRAPPSVPSHGKDESGLAEESKLVAEAFERLRRDRNPNAALALLDGYDQRFPAGMLRSEAEVARVEALLALGRGGAALERLEALNRRGLGSGPKARELRLLTAELQANQGRCAEAIDRFGQVFAADQNSGLAERALYGRAVCHERLGHAAESRSDLENYMRRFPKGRFASQVKRTLGQ